MRIELIHDLIAERIWEKLPQTNRRLRFILDSIADFHFRYVHGFGDLLEEKNFREILLYREEIIPLLDTENPFIEEELAHSNSPAIDPERNISQLEFFKKSETQVKKSRRRRSYLRISTLLVVFLSVSVALISTIQKLNSEKNSLITQAQKDSIQIQLLRGEINAIIQAKYVKGLTFLENGELENALTIIDEIEKLDRNSNKIDTLRNRYKLCIGFKENLDLKIDRSFILLKQKKYKGSHLIIDSLLAKNGIFPSYKDSLIRLQGSLDQIMSLEFTEELNSVEGYNYDNLNKNERRELQERIRIIEKNLLIPGNSDQKQRLEAVKSKLDF